MPQILVVDDDKDFLKIVRKVLEFANYTVVTASDARTAMERLAHEKFDLIISDANMPEASGFSLVQTLKRNSETASIPMALLTSRRNKEDVLKGVQSGADDYIVKPLDPDLFLKKVESLLLLHQKGLTEIEFGEGEVQMEATWEVKSTIVRMSEFGMTLWSPVSIVTNVKVQIASQLFEKIGIASPSIRVIECLPDSERPHMSYIQVSFATLKDSDRLKIRQWVAKNARHPVEKPAEKKVA